MSENMVLRDAINELCDADRATTPEGKALRQSMTVESVLFLAE
jgi:hypothetical protein